MSSCRMKVEKKNKKIKNKVVVIDTTQSTHQHLNIGSVLKDYSAHKDRVSAHIHDFKESSKYIFLYPLMARPLSTIHILGS